MAEGYYKPRKTVMTPDEIKKAQAKKNAIKKPMPKKAVVKKPQVKNKITKTPSINPKQESKPKNTAGGYSKRITYPKEELKPVKETGGIQKGGGKIGGYVKPKTISYNSTKGVIWALLIIFVVAVIFAVLYFTNSLDNIKIRGIDLGGQDLEMKISNVQIENDSLDLKMDIKPHGEDLVGVKIIVDDGVNFDIFKVELTKEEIEKGEIHLELDKVNGDRITKILISPILNEDDVEGVVGSVEESYIPKKTDFVNQRNLNNYEEPKDISYPTHNPTLKNQTNQVVANNTQTNQQQNNTNQTTNQTQDQLQEDINDSHCLINSYDLCYQEAIFSYNTCTNRWVLKEECSLEEVCIEGECILREDVVPQCGNGILEVGESCEKGNLVGENCESFGYISGTLSCNTNCAFDLRYCIKPEQECVPSCEGKECGSDGCQGICGECVDGQEECNSQGECIPIGFDEFCWFIENNNCIQGDDAIACDKDIIYSSVEECELNLDPLNIPCWFIENNDCIQGDDAIACDKDIIYSSVEECELNLIPEGCFPLETSEYICHIIDENEPGYDGVLQGEDSCGPCINGNAGEVVYSGGNYYCKCLIPSET